MKRNKRGGFTLLEVMIVTGISMIFTMTAMPNMVAGIGNIRLRSSMTSIAAVVQNSRELAERQNRVMSTHFQTSDSSPRTGVLAHVKSATDTRNIVTPDSQFQLEEPLVRELTPSGVGAPAVLDNSTLGFAPQTGDPSFNPAGLACAYSGGLCPNYGFVYYFHDSRPQGQTGWAALSISPAGGLKKWYWSGSSWTD